MSIPRYNPVAPVSVLMLAGQLGIAHRAADGPGVEAALCGLEEECDASGPPHYLMPIRAMQDAVRAFRLADSDTTARKVAFEQIGEAIPGLLSYCRGLDPISLANIHRAWGIVP